jgi:hypothetical protein
MKVFFKNEYVGFRESAAISRAFEIGLRLSVLARDERDCTRNHGLKRRGY